MPTDEIEIMRDAWRFLRDYNAPPAHTSEFALDYWKHAADTMSALARKWNNHPLAVGVLIAVYDYLDEKARQQSSIDLLPEAG